jgi:hypothetical protein
MKWFNPPRTLLQLKKRAQLYLLAINIILATTNLLTMNHKLNRIDDITNSQMILYCRTVNFTDTICAEQ